MKTEVLNRLETELRNSRPAAQIPADLHGSIISSVRRACSSVPSDSRSPFAIWLSGAFATTVLILGVWWTLAQPAHNQNTDLAWQMAPRLSEETAAAALSPLSNELNYLRQDLSNAVDFLVASVP